MTIRFDKPSVQVEVDWGLVRFSIEFPRPIVRLGTFNRDTGRCRSNLGENSRRAFLSNQAFSDNLCRMGGDDTAAREAESDPRRQRTRVHFQV